MLDNGLDRKMPRVKDALHTLIATASDASAVPTIEYMIARRFDVNYQVGVAPGCLPAPSPAPHLSRIPSVLHTRPLCSDAPTTSRRCMWRANMACCRSSSALWSTVLRSTLSPR